MDIAQFESMDLKAMTREQLIEVLIAVFDLLPPAEQKELLQLAEAGKR